MPALQEMKNIASKADGNPTEVSASQHVTSIADQAATATKSTTTTVNGSNARPVFEKSKVTVIFVLGGPGVGKGTQCEKLVKDYGFVHLSAGDLLRAEQARDGSEFGEMISRYIREGLIVPQEVTIKLLENAMRDALSKEPPVPAGSPLGEGWEGGRGRFLIDGFPRKMDQAITFDTQVCESTFILFFSCTEEVMLERLMERAKTSGREDDNKESIIKRFRTFTETSMPVVNYYREQNKVVEIDAKDTVDGVYSKVRVAVDKSLAEKLQ
ncbi:UMP-CMP kinase [Naganishia vaughanmartiniae]|uniref:UMP-CMP kinase n=1 Tax=Naganishia vaughanmartiniae TaxID=1424756 RepID=A0ACC2XNG2_9TREE|nr:UMP-CMP kinase [Naganishia vaughanmartiniae]